MDKRMRIRGNVIASIVFGLLAIGFIAAAIFTARLYGPDYFDRLNPNVFTATVESVQATRPSPYDAKTFQIELKEYQSKLYVAENAMVDPDAIEALTEGKTIHFQIVALDESMLNSGLFDQVEAIVLYTDEQEISTRESYLSYLNKGAKQARIALSVVSAVLLAAVGYNVYRIVKKRKLRNTMRQDQHREEDTASQKGA